MKGDYKVRKAPLACADERTQWAHMFSGMGRKQLMWYIRSTIKAGLHPGLRHEMVLELRRAIEAHDDGRPIWDDWRRSLKQVENDLRYIGQ